MFVSEQSLTNRSNAETQLTSTLSAAERALLYWNKVKKLALKYGLPAAVIVVGLAKNTPAQELPNIPAPTLPTTTQLQPQLPGSVDNSIIPSDGQGLSNPAPAIEETTPSSTQAIEDTPDQSITNDGEANTADTSNPSNQVQTESPLDRYLRLKKERENGLNSRTALHPSFPGSNNGQRPANEINTQVEVGFSEDGPTLNAAISRKREYSAVADGENNRLVVTSERTNVAVQTIGHETITQQATAIRTRLMDLGFIAGMSTPDNSSFDPSSITINFDSYTRLGEIRNIVGVGIDNQYQADDTVTLLTPSIPAPRQGEIVDPYTGNADFNVGPIGREFAYGELPILLQKLFNGSATQQEVREAVEIYGANIKIPLGRAQEISQIISHHTEQQYSYLIGEQKYIATITFSNADGSAQYQADERSLTLVITPSNIAGSITASAIASAAGLIPMPAQLQQSAGEGEIAQERQNQALQLEQVGIFNQDEGLDASATNAILRQARNQSNALNALIRDGQITTASHTSGTLYRDGYQAVRLSAGITPRSVFGFGMSEPETVFQSTRVERISAYGFGDSGTRFDFEADGEKLQMEGQGGMAYSLIGRSTLDTVQNRTLETIITTIPLPTAEIAVVTGNENFTFGASAGIAVNLGQGSIPGLEHSVFTISPSEPIIGMVNANAQHLLFSSQSTALTLNAALDFNTSPDILNPNYASASVLLNQQLGGAQSLQMAFGASYQSPTFKDSSLSAFAFIRYSLSPELWASVYGVQVIGDDHGPKGQFSVGYRIESLSITGSVGNVNTDFLTGLNASIGVSQNLGNNNKLGARFNTSNGGSVSFEFSNGGR